MNQLAVVLVVVLFPGILAAVLADKLTVHSKWSSFKYALYSLILGVLSYAFLQLLVYAHNVLRYWCTGTIAWNQLAIWKFAQGGTGVIPPWEVVSAFFLAIPLALVVSACIQHKWITRLGSWMRITDKYGDENLFSFFLNTKEVDWVYVRDRESNLTYQGRVFSFSENDRTHSQELVLYDVTAYRYEDSAELYSVPTVYISKPMGKFTIETIPSDLLKGST